MKILSLNVRIWTRDRDKSKNTHWIKRYQRINEYIREENPDIICLQEMWFPAAWVILKKLDYHKVGMLNFSHPVYVRKGVKTKNHWSTIHWSRCDVGDLRIIDVHGRWDDKTTVKLVEDINKMIDKKTISTGDYNVSIDKLRDCGLYSTREALGVEISDTFRNYKRPDNHGEIDHFLTNISPVSYQTGPDDLSDHRPIIMEF